MRTDNYMAVSGAIHDAIENQALLSHAFPTRTADTTRFEITASPKQITDLMDALAAVRPQCSDVILQVRSDLADGAVEIPDIENEQLKLLVYEDNPGMFSRLAGVSIVPGIIQLMLMFSLLYSAAMVSVRRKTAAFEAL